MRLPDTTETRSIARQWARFAHPTAISCRSTLYLWHHRLSRTQTSAARDMRKPFSVVACVLPYTPCHPSLRCFRQSLPTTYQASPVAQSLEPARETRSRLQPHLWNALGARCKTRRVGLHLLPSRHGQTSNLHYRRQPVLFCVDGLLIAPCLAGICHNNDCSPTACCLLSIA
jgi:hypothetical protein